MLILRSGTSATGASEDNAAELASTRKKLRMELLGEMHSTETDVTQSEIELYIHMRVPSEFDDKLLAFWQRHEESLPILSKVAQVYLGMSSSSVPVGDNPCCGEHTFKYSGIISNGKRSSIGPEKLNRVVFIHDNFSLAADECK